MAFKHILLPTDFSEGAELATSIAVELAANSGATITLFHAYSLPVLMYADGISFPMAELGTAAAEALQTALTRLRKRWPNSESMLVCGVPWQQILLAAEARGVDMVVMGTHGRRGLPRAILGSVAEKVVRLSPVPVLTAAYPRQPKAAA
jgi:nucleotide-binding universal stress UspA family protein